MDAGAALQTAAGNQDQKIMILYLSLVWSGSFGDSEQTSLLSNMKQQRWQTDVFTSLLA